jgi:hemoglobin-like flavoprotein
MDLIMDAEAITESLEQVAERCGDPTEAVYGLLFARHPDMRELFVRDTNGAIRGQMLHQAIEIVLDYIGARGFSANFIAAEVVNHENLGVPPEVFASLFGVMRDAFREVLGEAWTPAFDQAWRELVAELRAVTMWRPC